MHAIGRGRKNTKFLQNLNGNIFRKCLMLSFITESICFTEYLFTFSSLRKILLFFLILVVGGVLEDLDVKIVNEIVNIFDYFLIFRGYWFMICLFGLKVKYLILYVRLGLFLGQTKVLLKSFLLFCAGI